MSQGKEGTSYTYELVVRGARLTEQQRKWLASYAADMVNPGGKKTITCEVKPNPKVGDGT